MLAPEPKSYFDFEAWQVLPSVLWFVLAAVVLFAFRAELRATLKALASRVRSGAALKIAGFEIEAESAVHAKGGNSDFSNDDTRIGVRKDTDGSMAKLRDGAYASARGVMLVHKIQRTKQAGQQYDVLFYVIPHRGASLASVSKVEYFFGHYWGNKIFPSFDRGRGFPIVTCAYGTFLCIARICFNDGTDTVVQRYADFEMSGVLGPSSQPREG
jgi:hypothetical protein